MTASGAAARASSGEISGSGLASAKIRGLLAIRLTMSPLRIPAADNPRKASAPSITSSRVRASVSWANASLCGFISSERPL